MSLDNSLGMLLRGLGEGLTSSATKPNMTRYEPHKKQVAFHKSTRKGRIYLGGNRAGKTTANVIECLWWLTKTHPYRPEVNEIVGEVRGRLVCVDFVNGLEGIILPQFKQWCPKKYLIDGSWEKSYDKYEKTLTLNNGSFIEFRSYDQDLDKFAGTSRHFVSFDEECPKHIFNECRARIIDVGPIGSWWISMTPLDGLTWIYEDYYKDWKKLPDAEKPNYKTFIIQADMLDNPNIGPEEAEEYLSSLDPDERTAREHGNFINLGGQVFKNFKPEIHRISFADFKLDKSMRIYTSVDTGWVHPTAWLWHAVEPDGHVTTFHEIVRSFTTIEDWAREVKAYEKEFLSPLGMEVFLRTGDPALRQTRANTGVSDIQEYAKNGIYVAVDGVPAGPGSVNIGLIKMEQYMKPDKNGRPYWQYTDDCTTFESQMIGLRWATYSSKKMEFDNAPKGTIHKKDDDAPDSARYFFTLQPDLSFDPDTGELKSSYGSLLDSVTQPNEGPLYDLEEMFNRESKGEWSTYEADSVWDLEGLGD
jgi:phage terminase large subunit-like protein